MSILTDEMQDTFIKAAGHVGAAIKDLNAAANELAPLPLGWAVDSPLFRRAPILSVIIAQAKALQVALRTAADPDNWS